MKFLGLIAFLSLYTFSAQPEMIEFDETSDYVIQKVPYKACWSQEEDFQKIMGVSLDRYLTRVDKDGAATLYDKNVSPVGTGLIKKAADTMKRNVDLAQEEVRNLMNDYRAEWNIGDALPDAIVLFGGGKFNINLGLGAGATGILGVVIMPYCVTKVNKHTRRVTKTWDAEIDFVAWGGPNFGLGVGGGPKARVGLGLIWNLRGEFSDPGQFKGVFTGASTTITPFGFGINGKAGLVTTASSNFGLISAAIEIGPAMEVSLHKNVYGILPASQVLSWIGEGAEQKYQDEKRRWKNEVLDGVKDLLAEEKKGKSEPSVPVVPTQQLN